VIPGRDKAARPEPADPAGPDPVRTDPARTDPARTDPGGTDPAGDESLADALGAVARQLRERSAETLAPWDITPGHLRALRMLARHGTMRLSELSERLEIAPRTATEVVDALESRDLVRRLADLGDRRATLVEVTEHGAGILAEIRAARGTEAGRVFGGEIRARRLVRS
jgi:DNA-binding MarR family transcriptional regulator